MPANWHHVALDAARRLLRLCRLPHWLVTHWRRFLMQLVSCGVLAATLALAALITYEKQQAMRLKLDVPRTFGRLRVGLPLKWAVSSGGNGASDGADVANAEEMLPAEQGRRLTITRQRLGLGISLSSAQISPMQYMIAHRLLTGVLDERALTDACTRGELRIEPTLVAGWPGVSVEQNPTILTQRGPIWRKSSVACAILPGSQAVVVRISGPGTTEEADRKFLEEMCDAVRIIGLPPLPESGASAALYDLAFGLPRASATADSADEQSPPDSIALQPPAVVTVKVPRHFVLVPSNDPNRTGRDIITDGSSDEWITAELIPCLFFPGDSTSALRAMLLARDRDWTAGEIKSLGPTPLGLAQWQADVAGDSVFPSRAYLLSSGDGLALLAVFHGGLHAPMEKIDAAWRQIAASAKFLKPEDLAAAQSAFGNLDGGADGAPDASDSWRADSGPISPSTIVRRMLAAGATESSRLSDIGLAALAPRTGYQGWSLWDESDNADKIEWMEMSWSTSGEGPHAGWHGDRWTPLPDDELLDAGGEYSPGSARRTHQQWSGSANQQRYSTTGSRESRPGGRGAWDGGQPRQQVTVEDGRLRFSNPRMKLSSLENTSAAIIPSIPAQYVPGGWLPLLLPRISTDAGRMPLILRTESFVDCDALPLSDWLMLEIRNDPRTPGKVDEKGQPMGCVTVCVNGTGRLSRWYYTLSADAKPSAPTTAPDAAPPATSSIPAPPDAGAAPALTGNDRAKALRYADFADGLRARQDPEKRIVELGEPPKTQVTPQP